MCGFSPSFFFPSLSNPFFSHSFRCPARTLLSFSPASIQLTPTSFCRLARVSVSSSTFPRLGKRYFGPYFPWLCLIWGFRSWFPLPDALPLSIFYVLAWCKFERSCLHAFFLSNHGFLWLGFKNNGLHSAYSLPSSLLHFAKRYLGLRFTDCRFARKNKREIGPTQQLKTKNETTKITKFLCFLT
ncbi:uncharacterized protein [Primulina eburnea]|uniref:uncharacterized protein isoform X3 n=1 Tax=Primulina eburnea TaxID=1245227 RepID=UPI003C6CA16D